MPKPKTIRNKKTMTTLATTYFGMTLRKAPTGTALCET
jgi:hypothetical protein